MPVALLNADLVLTGGQLERSPPRTGYADLPTDGCIAWRLSAWGLSERSAPGLAELFRMRKVRSTEEPQTGEHGPSTLGTRIWAELRCLSDPTVEAALAPAVEQAAEYGDRQLRFQNPRVMFSADGIVTLQWRRPNLGAALIFAGDGTVEPVINNGTQTYLDSMDAMSLTDPLPKQIADIVNQIERSPNQTK